MNNEEKILEILAQLQETQKQMQVDLSDVKATQARMQADQEQMQATQVQMQADLTHVKARLDLDVNKRLDALAEGQSVIAERLSVLDEVKDLAERTSDKVDVIHAVVAEHSGSITELKKAK